jgi:hypothetical protein
LMTRFVIAYTFHFVCAMTNNMVVHGGMECNGHTP